MCMIKEQEKWIRTLEKRFYSVTARIKELKVEEIELLEELCKAKSELNKLNDNRT